MPLPRKGRSAGPASSIGKEEAGALRATFVGTADGFTRAGRDHSGILLESRDGGAESLLLDCGGDAPRFLLERGLAPDHPSFLWISHLHSDHIGRFTMLIQSFWLRGRRVPLRVLGPARVLQTLKGWLPQCLLFPELIGFPIEWQPVRPGHDLACGSFHLTPFSTRHLRSLALRFGPRHRATCFDCYGAAIVHAGRRHVYSADLARAEELVPILRGHDTATLICEMAHFSETDLFAVLAPHAIARLWLTHYPDRWADREAVLKRAARQAGFRGTVRLAQDRKRCQI